MDIEWLLYSTNMKITKLGHCCLVIKEKNVRMLTDPGGWTTAQNDQKNIDLILITHEHPDHFHLESLQTVLRNNPQAQVVTNRGVGKLLDEAGIVYVLLEDGQSHTQDSVLIEGYGHEHAPIYSTVPTVINTGYFVAGRLFYPGDALYIPPKPVEILALPVCGPWMKIAEVIDYLKAVKPQQCFPVHDGMLQIFGPFHALPHREASALGATFTALTPDVPLTV